MQLVCLGTTGFHPNRRRHTACYFLPDVGVVLDAGTGMFRLPEYLRTEQIEILLSHAHLDHVMGLTFLIETFGVEAHDRVTIRGREDKLTAVRDHLFAEPLFPIAPGYHFEPLGDSCALPENGTLRTFDLKHPGGSIGMRLEWPGHALAYVTDTTATTDAAYIDQIAGVDLLLHEANFPANHDDLAKLTGHSCLPDVAHVASKANVKRLVIVHVDPLLTKEQDFELAAAREIFPDISIAVDEQEIDF